MKVYVLGRDATGLREPLVFAVEELPEAEGRHDALAEAGHRTTMVLGVDLQDVMRSFPAWFEGPVSEATA